MENKEKVFLLGGSDGEMAHIKTTLIENNIPYIDKGLGRGAKVEDYADEIQQLIAEGKQPVAIELTGAGEGEYANVMVIDHHGERAHEKAAILQVLEVLGIDATLEDMLVAANDSAYIAGMQKLLNEEGITDPFEQEKMIRNIRFKDRQAQGITEEQESQAQEAVNKKEKILDGKLTIVRLPHSKSATVTDRLIGQYQNLLILSVDGEVNFFGDGKLCEDLKLKFEGRNGGSGLGVKGGNAYRGGYPQPDEVQNFVIDSLKEEHFDGLKYPKTNIVESATRISIQEMPDIFSHLKERYHLIVIEDEEPEGCMLIDAINRQLPEDDKALSWDFENIDVSVENGLPYPIDSYGGKYIFIPKFSTDIDDGQYKKILIESNYRATYIHWEY